ncbi:MAG: hypothetical protein ACJAWV_003211 [Flammeovirgaceae bacterium]|jgi:hypothetical protein
MISTGNTKVPSYLTILSKGYQVSLEMVEGKPYWSASNGLIEHVANDLDSLLGIVTMSEKRGTNWQATRTEISDFFKNFPQLKKK